MADKKPVIIGGIIFLAVAITFFLLQPPPPDIIDLIPTGKNTLVFVYTDT